MTIRFQADYDFNQDIITGVIRRQPGPDRTDSTGLY